MKIIIPGGSGQIGTLLARTFHAAGHEVITLSRNPTQQPWRSVVWDAESMGAWVNEIEGADVVINLAGHSVNCRYTPDNRRLIKVSRTQSTAIIGTVIAQARKPPRLWLQSSTATIYAHRHDAPNDELTGILGGNEPNAPDTWRFSIDVAKAWERAATEAMTPNTRQILLRSAMVMSPDKAGVFDVLLGLVRRNLGGQFGDGKQYVSWIHDQDFVRAILWLIEHEQIHGAINLAAPNPLPNVAFMRTLREVWGAKLGLPATTWMLEIGAAFLKTETELLLKSRRVVPTKLLQTGFEFAFPTWDWAAHDLCQRWREINHRPT